MLLARVTTKHTSTEIRMSKHEIKKTVSIQNYESQNLTRLPITLHDIVFLPAKAVPMNQYISYMEGVPISHVCSHGPHSFPYMPGYPHLVQMSTCTELFPIHGRVFPCTPHVFLHDRVIPSPRPCRCACQQRREDPDIFSMPRHTWCHSL